MDGEDENGTKYRYDQNAIDSHEFEESNLNTEGSESTQSIKDIQYMKVLIEGNAYSKTVVLIRPSSLNALNTSMANRLQKLYKRWEDRPDIGFVVMKGRGRGFCAGGDIVALHATIKKGN